jgi:hypothetical protein
MESYLQLLVFIIGGILLLWLGYFLFFGKHSPLYLKRFGKKEDEDTPAREEGEPGSPQTCPICSIKLIKGEKLKTKAFPSLNGKDRLMHIQGCPNCMKDGFPRRCPVCGNSLSNSDYLVSRMFERSLRRNHIHVLGCNHCRKVEGTLN